MKKSKKTIEKHRQNWGNQKTNYWTNHQDQLEYLKKWYGHLGPSILAKKFNTTENIVGHKAHELGLKIYPHSQRLCRTCFSEYCIPHKNECRRCVNNRS